METKRTSFVFYEGFYDAILELETVEEQMELLHAICIYEFTGEVLEMSYACRVAFKVIKRSLDSATKRYDASVANGKKGGRPKKAENLGEPKETYNNLGEPTITNNNQPEPTRNHSVSVSDSKSDSVSDSDRLLEETSSSPVTKSSSNNSSSSKRKSRKDQLVEYVNATSFAQETKDTLFKWIFQIGLKGNVTVDQLRDMLKNIWHECSGNELLVREAISNSYLNNWFGFYLPKKSSNSSEKTPSNHLTLDNNKNPALTDARVVQRVQIGDTTF